MILPNFLVIGTPKCATTAICRQLAVHPEICFSAPKEPFFFNREDRFSKGLEWYSSLFRVRDGQTAVGEGTTLYCCLDTYPNVLPRIASILGKPKIVHCVRNPFERIESYWIEMRSQGLTRKPFAEDIFANSEYLDASMYARTEERYAEIVGLDRIHTVFYEDFKTNPALVLKNCYHFLEVDDTFTPTSAGKVVYASEQKREDRAVTNLLRRRIPGFARLRGSSPKWFRSVAARTLKVRVAGRPEWTPEARSRVRSLIEQDIIQFLRVHDRDDLRESWLSKNA